MHNKRVFVVVASNFLDYLTLLIYNKNTKKENKILTNLCFVVNNNEMQIALKEMF